MISIQNISKSFGSNKAVDNLSLEIKKGEVVGLLGPNGAGKTTTMRMICGFLYPDSGQVLIDGKKIEENPEEVKKRFGYLPENNPLYEDMLVSEYLSFVASLKDIPKSERSDTLKEIAKETGVAEVYFKPIGELSKGYRQRVGLAQAILHKPDILIFDEPTEGLDPNQRVEIRKLITELGKDRTVLISTHVLGEVGAMCNRVVIINKGKLAADGTMADLSSMTRGKRRVIVEVQGDHVEENLRNIDAVGSIVSKPLLDNLEQFTLHLEKKEDIRPQIFNLAKQHGWVLYELHQEETSLEDVFRELTVD